MPVSYEYFSVALLDGTKIFFLNIHLMAHVGIGSCHRQTMKNMLHVGISFINTVVDAQDAVVIYVPTRLIEDTQHHIETIVDMTVQTGNLDDNTIMRQTVDKGVWKAFSHDIAIIVKRLMVDVKHGFFYVANLVA